MTENDVFRVLCKQSVCSLPYSDVTSVPTLSKILNATKYKIRKCIKNLERQGLVALDHVGGIDDDGYPHCYKGYCITDKALETEIYKKENEREMKYIDELLRK